MSGSRVERVLGEFRSHDYRYTIVLALLIGVLGGLGNLGFQALIDLFRHISWAAPTTSRRASWRRPSG